MSLLYLPEEFILGCLQSIEVLTQTLVGLNGANPIIDHFDELRKG
jgi:hypothetical protein